MVSGAGAGTGAELVTAFARRDADVVLAVGNVDTGEQVANSVYVR